ncbi:MAG: hypothetical protein J2P27_00075 [Actinobacteria bacterium]|nr:hypothetical protein [Actinomycetota bacterium]
MIAWMVDIGQPHFSIRWVSAFCLSWFSWLATTWGPPRDAGGDVDGGDAGGGGGAVAPLVARQQAGGV